MFVKAIRLVPSKAPSLPISPNKYDQRYGEIYSKLLRIYFNQIDNLFESILGVTGLKTLRSVYGSFYDTGNHTALANVATAVFLNGTAVANDVYIGSPTSRVYVNSAGVYNIQFSIQLSNTGTGTSNIDDVTIWFRLNGINIPNSASITQVPSRSGTIDGHIILDLNFMLEMNAGDYVELYWTSDTGTTALNTYPASVIAPIHPASPATILTVSFVSALMS